MKATPIGPYALLVTCAVLITACGAHDPGDKRDEADVHVSSLLPGFVRTSVTAVDRGTAMAVAPDGRIFYCEQGSPASNANAVARVRVVANGSLLATPFLSLPVNTAGTSTERGLIGIAFDPGFASNHYVYVHYMIAGDPTRNRVSRFTASGNVAAAGSELVLLEMHTESSAGPGNHNGGALLFGADGKLYVTVGENTDKNSAQVVDSYKGKLLRINKDGTVPTSNPFYDGGALTARDRVWALGFRNPFTAAVQPGTGRIFVNDVGQNAWEEIDDALAGKNYGWPTHEGVPPAHVDEHEDPLYAYSHSASACAITGGTFYDPTTPSFGAGYLGKYFFADYCAGWVRTIDPANQAVSDFEAGLTQPVDLEVGPAGELYVLTRATLWKIENTGAVTQNLIVSATDLTVNENAQATFTVKLAAAPPANVSVGVARTAGSTDVTVSPAISTFTPANWSTPQTVTVSAAADADLDTDSATVKVTSSGLTSRTVLVSALDDDASGIRTKVSAPKDGQSVAGTTAEFFGEDLGHIATKGQFFVDGVLRYEETIASSDHFHYGGGHSQWDTTQLTEGSHTLRLLLSQGTAASGHTIKVTVNNLPSPWNHRDIGAVGAIGSARHASGTFTVKGSGENILGVADEFHYVHRALDGDGEIRARVTSITNTQAWAKAGVMIRETLTAGSKHASIFVSPSSGAKMFFRAQTGGTTDGQSPLASIAAPVWLRIVRAGNTFTTYHSADGVSWTQLEQATVVMATAATVGLAVSARNDGAINTSTFTSVAVTP